MGFLGKMRKVWTRVAKRLRIRKNGLGKLRQEVRTCEYEDVHILWDLLKKSDKGININKLSDHRKGEQRGSLDITNWAKCAPFLYRGV